MLPIFSHDTSCQPAMRVRRKLQTDDGMPLHDSEARKAILSGLVKAEDDWFEKTAIQDLTPLKLGMKKDVHEVVIVDPIDWNLNVEDDDLID